MQKWSVYHDIEVPNHGEQINWEGVFIDAAPTLVRRARKHTSYMKLHNITDGTFNVTMKTVSHFRKSTGPGHFIVYAMMVRITVTYDPTAPRQVFNSNLMRQRFLNK